MVQPWRVSPRDAFPCTWLMRTLRLLAIIVSALALSACHPGNQEAKRLDTSCESGDLTSCNALAGRLHKGEYILRDDARAAALYARSCDGRVGEACASLGVMHQRGIDGKRDSVRA